MCREHNVDQIEVMLKSRMGLKNSIICLGLIHDHLPFPYACNACIKIEPPYLLYNKIV